MKGALPLVQAICAVLRLTTYSLVRTIERCQYCIETEPDTQPGLSEPAHCRTRIACSVVRVGILDSQRWIAPRTRGSDPLAPLWIEIAHGAMRIHQRPTQLPTPKRGSNLEAIALIRGRAYPTVPTTIRCPPTCIATLCVLSSCRLDPAHTQRDPSHTTQRSE